MFEDLYRVAKNAVKLNQSKIEIKVWKNKDVKVFILDLNLVEQLLKRGEDSTGSNVGEYSADRGIVTFKGVSKSKYKGNPYVLFDTGDFYKSFNVEAQEDGFKIKADEMKGDFSLTERYGIDVLGLTDESKEKLAQMVLPILIAEVRKSLLK